MSQRFSSTRSKDFYPRSPRGERLHSPSRVFKGIGISIHAPREGSDRIVQKITRQVQHFYPRSPRGERLILLLCAFQQQPISIHAPREGSDMQTVSQWATTSYFYPRSPRGERPGS